MERKKFLIKMIRVMKGFGTAKEIKEEYDYLSKYYKNPQRCMVENIECWLRINFGERDPQFTIWERLKKEGL